MSGIATTVCVLNIYQGWVYFLPGKEIYETCEIVCLLSVVISTSEQVYCSIRNYDEGMGCDDNVVDLVISD